MVRLFPKIVLVLILVYLLFTLVVYFSADKLIFLPPEASYEESENLIFIDTKNNKKLAAYFIQQPTADKTILFSHGNAEDIGISKLWLENLSKQLNVNILAYDYAGYGLSSGSPSEKQSYKNIEAAYEYLLNNNISPDKIVVYGRSIGTGPSVYLASKRQVGAVILQSPFTSANDTITQLPIFPIEKFNNLARINNIEVPVLFIHGKQDEVINFNLGQKLYKNFKGEKFKLWLEKAGHNNIEADYSKDVISIIDSFLGI